MITHNDQVVWASKTGRCYHQGCERSFVDGCGEWISLRSAWNGGLYPCGTCKPPNPILSPPPILPPTQEEVNDRTVEKIREACFGNPGSSRPADEWAWRVQIEEILRDHRRGTMKACARELEERFGASRQRWAA